MTAKVLLRGIIDTDGSIKATPVIVTLNSEKEVLSYEFLGSCEPHSTIFDPTLLLDLRELKLV